MRTAEGIGLKEVQGVYSGPEVDLWELIMGQQIHIGGISSSMALCEKTGKLEGLKGVDLCCCSGAGMRFLVRFCKAAEMVGVDATEKMIQRGQVRCSEEGLANRIRFVQRDACDTGLPGGQMDFVWGEDAWCYVENKAKLIAEAVRIVKTGGTIAFTDWVEGDAGLGEAAAERFLKFMKFPNLLSIKEYRALLEKNGCEMIVAEDTKQFTPHIELYINMLSKQLTYDALKIIGFDMNVMNVMAGEMSFMKEMSSQGRIAQGRFVARKK